MHLHCFTRHPIAANYNTGFPRALLSLGHAQKRRALGSRMQRQRDVSDNGARRGNNREGLDREPRCVVYFEVNLAAASRRSKFYFRYSVKVFVLLHLC